MNLKVIAVFIIPVSLYKYYIQYFKFCGIDILFQKTYNLIDYI